MSAPSTRATSLGMGLGMGKKPWAGDLLGADLLSPGWWNRVPARPVGRGGGATQVFAPKVVHLFSFWSGEDIEDVAKGEEDRRENRRGMGRARSARRSLRGHRPYSPLEF